MYYTECLKAHSHYIAIICVSSYHILYNFTFVLSLIYVFNHQISFLQLFLHVVTVNSHSKCVCVCAFELARQAASSMPVGGGVSSPDTGCLYCSVYCWHSATQLSFDLWIGIVCICTKMSGC